MLSVILCKIGLHLPDRHPLRERDGVLTGRCRRCNGAIYRDDRHDRWAPERARS